MWGVWFLTPSEATAVHFSDIIDSTIEEMLEKATSNLGLHLKLPEMTQDTIDSHVDAMSHHAGAIQRLRADPKVQEKLQSIKSEADIDADPDLSRLASHAARYTAHLARLKELDTMQRKGEQHGFTVRLDTPNLGGANNPFLRHGRLKAANPATGEPAQFRTDSVTKNIHYLGFPEYEAVMEKPDHPSFGQPKQEFPFASVKVNGAPVKPKTFEDVPDEAHPHDAYPGLSLRKKHGGQGTYMGTKTMDRITNSVLGAPPAESTETTAAVEPEVKKSAYAPDITDAHFVLAKHVVAAADPFVSVSTDALCEMLSKSLISDDSPSTKAIYVVGAMRRLEELSKAEGDEEAPKPAKIAMPKLEDLSPEMQERKMQPTKTPSGRDTRLPWFNYSGPAHPEGKLTEFDHDEEVNHLQNLAAEHGSLATAERQRRQAAATPEESPQLAHDEAVKRLRADLASGNVSGHDFAARMKDLMGQRKQTVTSRVSEEQMSPTQRKIAEEVEPLTGGTGYKPTTVTPAEQEKRRKLTEATDAAAIDPEAQVSSAEEARRSITGEGGGEEGDIDASGVGIERGREEKPLSSAFMKQWMQHRKKALSHVGDDPHVQDYVEHLLAHTATHNPHELPLLVESLRQAHQAHHDNVFETLKDAAADYGTRRLLGTVGQSEDVRQEHGLKAKADAIRARAKEIMTQPDEDVTAPTRTEKPKMKVEVRRKQS
jgi:hypothetical protein